MSKRRCERCGTKLPGRLGHGYPSRDGKMITCGRRPSECKSPRDPTKYQPIREPDE